MSACLFANLSFFICLCASCFSEMAVSKSKNNGVVRIDNNSI